MDYQPGPDDRFFNKDAEYSHIDRSSLSSVVTNWEKRIRSWYIEPIEWLDKYQDAGHFSFAVMALNTLLIDMMSQYYLGKPESKPRYFKQYIRERLPSDYRGPLSKPIYHGFGGGVMLTEKEDVIYSLYRCGILHEAHVPMPGLIDPGKTVAFQELGINTHTEYSTHAARNTAYPDCLSIQISPWLLFKDLRDDFDNYCKELLLPSAEQALLPNTQQLSHFKKKFRESFGIDISSAK